MGGSAAETRVNVMEVGDTTPDEALFFEDRGRGQPAYQPSPLGPMAKEGSGVGMAFPACESLPVGSMARGGPGWGGLLRPSRQWSSPPSRTTCSGGSWRAGASSSPVGEANLSTVSLTPSGGIDTNPSQGLCSPAELSRAQTRSS
jgi:hypothetical protein